MTETTTALAPDDLMAMYRLMLLGRRFTERALHWFTQGRVPQGLHPSIGQEAVGVGGWNSPQAGSEVSRLRSRLLHANLYRA